MGDVSEIDALKAIDDMLSKISDSNTKDRILDWAFKKYSSMPKPVVNDAVEDDENNIVVTKKKPKKKKAKTKAKNKTKTSTSLSIVKDLNLKPSGKKSFKDFVDEKKPSSNQQKCVVSVYYLINKLKLSNIEINHIYTCYKDAGWRTPADLANTLQYTASVKGWLDTRHSADIKLTTHGDNLIEYDLPPKKTDK